jgi:hypothetical protein
MKAVCVLVDEIPCGCFGCIFRKSLIRWVDVNGMKYFTHTCIVLNKEIEDISIRQEECILKLDRRKNRKDENKN